MKALEVNLKKFVFVTATLLIVSLLINLLFPLDAYHQSLIGLINNYSLVLSVVLVFMWLIVLDLNKKSFARIQAIYYISCMVFFITFLYIRYNDVMPGNGILLLIPALVCLASLLVLTLIGFLKKQKGNSKIVMRSWGTLLLTILIVFLLVQYL